MLAATVCNGSFVWLSGVIITIRVPSATGGRMGRRGKIPWRGQEGTGSSQTRRWEGAVGGGGKGKGTALLGNWKRVYLYPE